MHFRVHREDAIPGTARSCMYPRTVNYPYQVIDNINAVH